MTNATQGSGVLKPAWVKRVISIMTSLLGYVGGIGVLLLMFHVTADVLLRFTLNTTLPATLEVSQYWYLPMIIFLGLAVAYRNDEHISAPIVYDNLSEKLRREFRIVAAILSVVFLLAMAWWGFEEAARKMIQGDTGIGSGVIIWPPRFLVPIGSLMFAIEIVVRAIPDFLRSPKTESSNPEAETVMDRADPGIQPEKRASEAPRGHRP